LNALKELSKYGQSFWLDYIRRSLITGGELHRMVEEDGLRGVTSNPTIFQKAIAGSSDYDDIIRNSVKADSHMDVNILFEKLSIEDIQLAADILRPVYEETKGSDGFVSLELSPLLARDTEGSIEEARRLWKIIKRPNVMLKVPATKEGIPVIEKLIEEGINVNVTLLFSLSQYESVAKAYIRGLERCKDPTKVSSVASFFLSRIDKAVDKKLEEIGTLEALELRGKIAVANAKMAYKLFKEIFSGESWASLVKRGARVQRVLWASTGTKNPAYSDVLYVEELIGSDTVNTMPPVTLNAFRDHGRLKLTIEEGQKEAENQFEQLSKLGINLNEITEELQKDGVRAFADSFNQLISTLEEKRQIILQKQADIRTPKFGKYQTQIAKRLDHLRKTNFIRRIWEKDYTLWTIKTLPEITDRLGWLSLPETMHSQLEVFVSFANQIKSEGFRYAVLLGMGGSSLAPEVYQKIFGNKEGYPKLIVLDSTHPSAIDYIENEIDLIKTLFIVSSKSGTTMETLSLFRYFWKKIGEVDKDRGRHFIAISDPGTPLIKLAEERGFRRAFQATPDVGGRYSALTAFGLLPASLIGMDVHQFIDRAWTMSESCAFCVSSNEATGLIIGSALGELTNIRKDKVTFLTSSSIGSFSDWVEQLIAESTGKDGKGIIPIVNEPITSPDNYGEDRFFVHFFSKEDNEADLDGLVEALERKGHPIISINLTDKLNLSQEIFSWELAIAATGSIIGIHPFNQPNVQMAKDLAKKMMEKTEKGIKDNEGVETISIEDKETLSKAIKEWINQAKKGDYIAIQAYLPRTVKTNKALQKIRNEFLNRYKLATTLGYGPRFLHSTGQLHKGGPNTGLFIQLIDELEEDLAVPETSYTFGTLIKAQALGDYKALRQLNRRILRINLKRDIIDGLSSLNELIKE